jgi:DNA replication licensing factor MCM3
LNLFRTRLDHVFTTSLGADGIVDFTDLVPLVNEGLENDQMFGTAEARSAVDKMNEGNEIMFSEGTVYKI